MALSDDRTPATDVTWSVPSDPPDDDEPIWWPSGGTVDPSTTT